MLSKLNYFRPSLLYAGTKGVKFKVSQSDFTISGNVLVAPLDWGLGHATRCVPVVRKLLEKNVPVLLAGDGKIKAILLQEFPQLPFLDLPGYQVEYAKERWWLPFHIAGQIPKILAAIEAEQEWLQNAVVEHNICAVISDNRYGLYHPAVPTVFITHQLLIKTGLGKLMDEMLQDQNYGYINRFNECWIPDLEAPQSLAGELAHPSTLPQVPCTYVGMLSRFSPPAQVSGDKHLLVILSGPEPQRSIFETLLIDQLQHYAGPAILVRGLPGSTERPGGLPPQVQVYNHLASADLEQLIAGAGLVIGRCGYSTVMDLVTLNKKSILVPTPGQTEQEYLARHLMKKGVAFCVEQEKFRLTNVLELSSHFNYQLPQPGNSGLLDEAVRQLLFRLQASSQSPG